MIDVITPMLAGMERGLAALKYMAAASPVPGPVATMASQMETHIANAKTALEKMLADLEKLGEGHQVVEPVAAEPPVDHSAEEPQPEPAPVEEPHDTPDPAIQP